MKTKMPSNRMDQNDLDNEYRERFLSARNARYYEEQIYHPASYDSFIWELQKPLLSRIFDNVRSSTRSISYLDFACGTGRIISALESRADHSIGVDISREMLSIAKRKTQKAKFIVADLLKGPHVLKGKYDIITAFRFFLNVDREVRSRIMLLLASYLNGNHGRLIFNIHGNAMSVRHISVVARGLMSAHENEMSIAQVQRLVESSGLEIEAHYGFGILPRKFHWRAFGRVMRGIDRWVSQKQLLGRFCQDVVYICRKKQ